MRYLILLTLFIFIGYCSRSQNINTRDAKNVAQNFLKSKKSAKNVTFLSNTNDSVKYVKTIYYNNNVSYYIVQFEHGGFITVSSYEGYTPILSYVETGEYDESNLPPSYAWWMDLYSKEINLLRTNNDSLSGVRILWSKYKNSTPSVLVNSSSQTTLSTGFGQDVPQLLSSKWGQEYPYNNFCPSNPSCSGNLNGHCSVGCAAIACGQVMRYWGYPVNILSDLFFNYNWCDMPDRLYSSSPPIQQFVTSMFLLKIGINIGMNYCTKNSCASGIPDLKKTRDALNDYGYTTDYKTSLSASEAYAELLENRPIIMGGVSKSGEGHAFVIEGYDNSSNMFYYNWGWNGDWDGLYGFAGHIYITYGVEFLFSKPNNQRNCGGTLDIGEKSASILPNDPLLDILLYSPDQWYGTLLTANNSFNPIFRTIKSGKTAIYRAVKEIILQDGFNIELGATFDADIIPCPYPCSKPNY